MKRAILFIAISAMMAGASAKCRVIEYAELQAMDKAEITAVYCGYIQIAGAALNKSKSDLRDASKMPGDPSFARGADKSIAEAQACLAETRRMTSIMRKSSTPIPEACDKTQ